MDVEDLEGSVGSDLDDLINIECDIEDDDFENIDTSLLLSDTEHDIQPEAKIEGKDSLPSNISESKTDKTTDSKEEVKSKVEPKIPPVKKADSVKAEAKTSAKLETKPPKTVETKTPVKTSVKTEIKTPASTGKEKKPSEKVEEKLAVKKESKAPVKVETKTPAKSESKPPVKTETKTPAKSESKSPVKTEAKTPAKSVSKSPVKAETNTSVKNGEKSADKTAVQTLVKKAESKQVDKKEASKKKESTSGLPSGAELVVIDDDDEVRSVETIEGDVDDFPEEWMVLDEMDDDPKGKDSVNKNRDDKSRKERDSSRYRSRRRRSRSRSRTRSRSRSRGRGRSDSRRRDRERDYKSRSSSHRTPDRKGAPVSKPVEKSKPIEKKETKLPEKKAATPKTAPDVKQTEASRTVDPFKNMRDTIEKFDKSWRWNLKISPVDINDLNNETFRQIMALANDSVLVFNMQNDKKRKYGFLDLCLTSAGEVRQAIDKLSQLRLETNFVHVSVSHKLFEQNAGTESALLKFDLREGRHITSTPVKGTEKQRKINISNGPKGMSKIILDAIFAKIVNIVITDNIENETRNATVMCANPESVGGVLRFYQSVVIGGRRLQIRSEVPPPPPLKEAPKEDRKSPAALSSNGSKSSNQKSRQDDRNKHQTDNRRRGGQSNNNDGLLGPGPQDRRRAMEEAERRQESLSRLGITVGVDDFLERPGLLEAPDIVIKETKRLQREFSQNQQIFENNMIQEFRMQEDMRIRDIELRHQAELAEQKHQQEELILRMQQERDQHLQAQKRMELEQQERERMQRIERVSLEKQRLEQELIERDRLERLKQAKLESDRIERERIEKKRKEDEERARKEKLAREQLEREQRERERLEEIKRQAELRRQREEHDAKLHQEQQQRDRYIRPDLHHGSSNNWQHSLHLQNEQEQFEKEIGLRSESRKRQSRFDPPEQPVEEKKNLHQKIREQWEKQVAEASRSNQPSGQNNQRDDRRNENNGNNTSGNWGRPDHIPGRSDLSKKDPYGGTWDMPGKAEGSGFGGSWGAAAKGQGLLGAAPSQPDPVPSAYSSTAREYGHQSGKRNNPWDDQAPTYGEKRNRGAEIGDFNYQQRDLPSLMGERPGEQWGAQPSREPERNYDQGKAGWGSGVVDPYRNQGHHQQQQPYQPQQHHPQPQHHQQQHQQHQQQQQYRSNW